MRYFVDLYFSRFMVAFCFVFSLNFCRNIKQKITGQGRTGYEKSSKSQGRIRLSKLSMAGYRLQKSFNLQCSSWTHPQTNARYQFNHTLTSYRKKELYFPSCTNVRL